MAKNRKSRTGIVYSTDPGFEYSHENEEEEPFLPPEKQKLKVIIDRKKRKGKTVTIVKGFTGSSEDLKSLGKLLKSRCGTGGSEKDGEIIIQGELKSKIEDILRVEGYGV